MKVEQAARVLLRNNNLKSLLLFQADSTLYKLQKNVVYKLLQGQQVVSRAHNIADGVKSVKRVLPSLLRLLSLQ